MSVADSGSQPRPRFIAGAVCPGCGALDKLKAWTVDGVQSRECVACGFADRMSVNSPQGIPTRVDPGPQPQKSGLAPEPSERPIQFHPRPPKKP